MNTEIAHKSTFVPCMHLYLTNIRLKKKKKCTVIAQDIAVFGNISKKKIDNTCLRAQKVSASTLRHRWHADTHALFENIAYHRDNVDFIIFSRHIFLYKFTYKTCSVRSASVRETAVSYYSVSGSLILSRGENYRKRSNHSNHAVCSIQYYPIIVTFDNYHVF